MPALPTDALNCLKQTHADGYRTLQQAHYTPENVEIAIEVERHRWYWKPEQPKLILLAESHVLTTEQDLDFRTDEAKIRSFLRPDASLPPDRFVRLVYCLAYGESELLSQQPTHISNPGTPSYWDIFGRVAFRCPQPRREDGAKFNDRMRWKIDTLRGLFKMGIWLLDASVHAICRRDRHRLRPEIQQELHKRTRSSPDSNFKRARTNGAVAAVLFQTALTRRLMDPNPRDKDTLQLLRGFAHIWSDNDYPLLQPNDTATI